MQKGVLVLFSGGADSRLLAEWAADRVSLGQFEKMGLVAYTYGQCHKGEMEAVRRSAVDYVDKGASLFPVDLKGAFDKIESPLLRGSLSGQVYEGVHPCHVPARNMVFVSVASGIAESYGYDQIWMGADMSDYQNSFPDCTQMWVNRMDAVTREGCSYPIGVQAPLLGWLKEDVVRALEARGVDLSTVYSGYGGNVDGYDDGRSLSVAEGASEPGDEKSN